MERTTHNTLNKIYIINQVPINNIHHFISKTY